MFTEATAISETVNELEADTSAANVLTHCPLCGQFLHEFILPRLGYAMLKCLCGFKIGKHQAWPGPRYSLGHYETEPPF